MSINKDFELPQNILEVNNLKVYYPIRKGLTQHIIDYVRAVDGISFKIKRGTTMALVGESGCGKSTTGKAILKLVQKTDGDVLFDGKEIYSYSKEELRRKRAKMQFIFQDPYSSLSPRLPIGEIIGEAVREHKIVEPHEYENYLDKTMKDCGLQSFYKERYPHEFSGGQRQRICIARAIALQPEFIICDEPVSALDVSIQAQIINLLTDLQKERNLTYLFISHDLSVVEHIASTLAVMYLGSIVEYGSCDAIFSAPRHPYTQALLSAIPIPNPDIKKQRIMLKGVLPSSVPCGCKFHTRCQSAMPICAEKVPPQINVDDEHYYCCHLSNAAANI
ncbi:MAG: ABC transporter ATP-binding protein [Termitinemataceae bacterium]|nr:MAG: ABC transporter ATP-binding protein [Termitinemataceae bacterium]